MNTQTVTKIRKITTTTAGLKKIRIAYHTLTQPNNKPITMLQKQCLQPMISCTHD
jgi:hypothetical protein